MKIYEVAPEKNIKRLTLLITVLLFGAAVTMGVPTLAPDMPFRWVLQLAGVAMLVLAVFLTARFVMKSYVYRIEDTELTVTEVQGRSVVTVCRLSLSHVEDAVELDGKDADARARVNERIKRERRKSFNYCADIFEGHSLMLFATEGGEPLCIKLSYDAGLAKYLE